MSQTQKKKEPESIPYTVEIRKAESALLKAAMLFNPVEYAKGIHVDVQQLQDVLPYHYLKRASFTAIMDHIGRTVNIPLAWSTPMTCVAIRSIKGAVSPMFIMLTQSNRTQADLNKLSWSIFFHSPTLRRKLAQFGFEETVFDVCPLPFDFIDHKETGRTVVLKDGVVDRLFCAIVGRDAASEAELSALHELSIGHTNVGENHLFMFSMLKFYMDHYLLMVAPTGEFFDISTMDLLTPANRDKLFGLVQEAAAKEASLPSVLETVSEASEKVEDFDLTSAMTSIKIVEDGEVIASTDGI